MRGSITIHKAGRTMDPVVLQISIDREFVSRVVKLLTLLRLVRSQRWDTLDARMLRDIGKSDAEAECESAMRSAGSAVRPTEHNLRGQVQPVRSRQ